MENTVFRDLKIAAFNWAMVGPLTLKFFADYGATVVRVETSLRPCVTRTSAPYKNNVPGINRSGYFNHFSANMMSLSLNMNSPQGLGVAKDLIAWSDVVMENFTPGVMDKWGLGYEALTKIKPDIIMVRQNGFGIEGPYKNLAAFGMILRDSPHKGGATLQFVLDQARGALGADPFGCRAEFVRVVQAAGGMEKGR